MKYLVCLGYQTKHHQCTSFKYEVTLFHNLTKCEVKICSKLHKKYNLNKPEYLQISIAFCHLCDLDS